MKTTLFTILCTSVALAQDAPLTRRRLVLLDAPGNATAARTSGPSKKAQEARGRAARAFAFATVCKNSKP